MEKVILIRYGEIFLKGKNKKYFESLLFKNIIQSINGIKAFVTKSQSRFYVTDFDVDDLELLLNKLGKVFGIYSMSIAYKIPTKLDTFANLIKDSLPDNGTFRVNVKRADKTIPMTSTEIACNVGGEILELKPNLTVDLHNPQHVIHIDIRENNTTYIFYDIIQGSEGMPVGSAGKGLLLLSGGIDSPVAGYQMAKRGMQISGIHFHSYPFTSLQAKEKVVDLAKIMSDYTGTMQLYVIPFTKIQQSIHDYCREDFMITIMRMIMMRISERIAEKCGCGALISGECLGQVASQTLESITVSNSQVEKLPFFRPLISFDKTEIIKIAKKIGTFETSILPFEDCCTIFLPKNPIIKPSLITSVKELNKIPNLEVMIDEAIENVEKLTISK